jgi:hypothetical protein
MISHDFWKRRFAMSPTAIGRVISLSGTQFTIVGVILRSFDAANQESANVSVGV